MKGGREEEHFFCSQYGPGRRGTLLLTAVRRPNRARAYNADSRHPGLGVEPRPSVLGPAHAPVPSAHGPPVAVGLP
jgi:hypothetical protein